MTNLDHQELLGRVMHSVRANEAGWFDRLFAYLFGMRIAQGEAFTQALVGEVFAETMRTASATPSSRDQLDIEELFDVLRPHVERLRSLRYPEQYAEIFKLIYRP